MVHVLKLVLTETTTLQNALKLWKRVSRGDKAVDQLKQRRYTARSREDFLINVAKPLNKWKQVMKHRFPWMVEKIKRYARNHLIIDLHGQSNEKTTQTARQMRQEGNTISLRRFVLEVEGNVSTLTSFFGRLFVYM
jgi:hypothetical protein